MVFVLVFVVFVFKSGTTHTQTGTRSTGVIDFVLLLLIWSVVVVVVVFIVGGGGGFYYWWW